MNRGFRLKECRLENKMTQQQVADYLGVSRVCYTNYENGKREIPIENIIKLAKLYKCSTDAILGSWYYYAMVGVDAE